jgi:hypothetical protein
MENKRFMIIILGSSRGIDSDLNEIADGEYGVNYVDGNGIFIGTFYSHLNTLEIHELLADRPAFLLFDISKDTHAVNLPTKYYKGLFPEVDEILPKVKTEPKTNKKKVESDLLSIDQILDKLRENNFDTSCLTEKENEILKNY